MSARRGFQKAKFFCGLIFRPAAAAERAIDRLQDLLSQVDGRSAVIPFDQTDYYRAEMGEPLFRLFVSFRRLLDPQRLPGIKIAAMRLEEELADAGRRAVNIDPGYMSEANVIIATAKNHYHRVPLADGIYAHLEFVLKEGRIQPLPWTYPDFHSEAYLDFFRRLQQDLRRQRRQEREDGVSG